MKTKKSFILPKGPPMKIEEDFGTVLLAYIREHEIQEGVILALMRATAMGDRSTPELIRTGFWAGIEYARAYPNHIRPMTPEEISEAETEMKTAEEHSQEEPEMPYVPQPSSKKDPMFA